MNFKLALLALVSTMVAAELTDASTTNDAAPESNLRGRELGVSGTENKESCMYYYYKRTGCAKKWLGVCVQDKMGKSLAVKL